MGEKYSTKEKKIYAKDTMKLDDFEAKYGDDSEDIFALNFDYTLDISLPIDIPTLHEFYKSNNSSI